MRLSTTSRQMLGMKTGFHLFHTKVKPVFISSICLEEVDNLIVWLKIQIHIYMLMMHLMTMKIISMRTLSLVQNNPGPPICQGMWNMWQIFRKFVKDLILVVIICLVISIATGVLTGVVVCTTFADCSTSREQESGMCENMNLCNMILCKYFSNY